MKRQFQIQLDMQKAGKKSNGKKSNGKAER